MNKEKSTAMQFRMKRSLSKMLQPLGAIFVGLLVGAVIIVASGENVFYIYQKMFQGGFGSGYYIFATLTRATPIIFCSLATCCAWSAGQTTIGIQGQMEVGAFAAVVAALMIPGSGIVKIICAILVSLVAGGAYSALAAWLKDKFGIILVISTLMLNYVATYMVEYLITIYFKDKSAISVETQTELLDPSARLPALFPPNTLHLGFIIALIVVVVIYIMFKKTSFGYAVRMNGYNPDFVRYGGINSRKLMYIIMIISGAIAGLGGACEVLGTKGRYVVEMLTAPAFAWSGIQAALIANFNPVGSLVCAIFLAGIQMGGTAIERSTSLPLEITSIIQATITLFVSAKIVLKIPRVRAALSRFGRAQKQKEG